MTVVYLRARVGRASGSPSPRRGEGRGEGIPTPPAGGFYVALRRQAGEDEPLPTLRLVPPEAARGRTLVRPEGVRARFEALRARWKDETQLESSSTKLFLHPAYQQIIGLGPEALPLLLDALAEEPDHWSWALKAITGEDPVPEGARGNVAAMAAAWLQWAERVGLR